MAKEIRDIITAFREASKQGRHTALATVVHVEGSSYRRPGARMLVEDNGKMTGAISGGCLEGDALRKALLAITQRQNKLVTYDTLHEDEAHVGVQLGCNGIVHILFEPIDPNQPNNPVEMLEKCQSNRSDAVLVTLFSLKNFQGYQPGTRLYFDGTRVHGTIEVKDLETLVTDDASFVFANGHSLKKDYTGYELSAFVELVKPVVSLIIVGAGNDAIPLVQMAKLLGWDITLADGRVTHANNQRFPQADNIYIGKPAAINSQLVLDEMTVAVLMTHNYHYDLEMMELLLQSECRYIGSLGPRKRLDKMLTELDEKGVALTTEQKDKIFGPTGLDLGAETAEEIALSILAEIKAVLAHRGGSFLRDKTDSIHSRSGTLVDETGILSW
ncbi:MAG: XdhC family protein [Bacteroidota bacterium]